MPLLGGLMVALFTALADFFLKFFTKNVALRLAFGALVVGGFGVLYAAAQASVAALSVGMPDALAAGLSFVLPGNAAACLSAALAADLGALGYRLYVTGLGGNA